MTNLVTFGVHDAQTVEQMTACMQHGQVAGAVLCADGHLGYAQPVGGVIAYEGQISISGVGFDIGCGNLAVRTDMLRSDLKLGQLEKIADDIASQISFGIGRTNDEKVDHELFEYPEWTETEVGHLKGLARDQLGTVGGGNHYVDVFFDEIDRIWVGVHFGSRGFGHKTATHYLKRAGGQDGIHVAPTILDETSDLGGSYLRAMKLAGAYAYAGREWVVNKVLDILGARAIEDIHNHHNYAWKEMHGTNWYWVVRKGATPAMPGQKGFVGGSMGDISVILEGVNGPKSAEAFYSTVHGAGRIHGRMAAKGKRNKDGTWKRMPLFTTEQMNSHLNAMRVIRRGGDVDESPFVYRNLWDVLGAHRETVKIREILSPMIVVMAPPKTLDPYKD